MMESLEGRFQGLTVQQRLALYRPLHPEAVLRKKCGREVCSQSKKGRAEYAHRREFLYEVFDSRCCLCDRPIAESEATLEHPDGRGMGGGHRDDSITVCLIACVACQGRKGSRRIAKGVSCKFCGFGVVVGKLILTCFRCNAEWSSQ